MLAALPKIKVPVLLIHSKADQEVPFACMTEIFDRLGSQKKEMLAPEGMGHSLVKDPRHQVVFETVEKFLGRIGKPG